MLLGAVRIARSFALLLFLTSCSGTFDTFSSAAKSVRDTKPANIAETGYLRLLSAEIAAEGLQRHDRLFSEISKQPGSPPDDQARANERKKLAELAAPRLRDSPEASDAAPGRYAIPDTAWRLSRQTLVLKADGPDTEATFSFSGIDARQVEIELKALGPGLQALTLTCDGDLAVIENGWKTTIAKGHQFDVSNAQNPNVKIAAHLEPGRNLKSCHGVLSIGGKTRPIRILRQEAFNPDLHSIDTRFDVCAAKRPHGPNSLDDLLSARRFLSETCPLKPSRTVFLTEERPSFNAKVKALLGRELSDAFIDAQDPEAPIDFSAAPELKLIVLSFLDIKADFSGRVIDRLVRHHAARGTTVRILTSDVLERPKDRDLLEKLSGDFPNVQVRFYRWKAPKGANLEEFLSEFHKVHHVKLLATVAARPANSVAIIGGRNIHDGFLFDQPTNLAKYPNLQQYRRNRGLTVNYYSNWHDFDLEIHGDAAVRTLVSHFSTVWLDDGQTHLARPFTLTGRNSHAADETAFRHFISLPYLDGAELETFYVDMLDSARKKIEIVNPYLHMTPALNAAFDRAIARGVAVTIIGRINLKGDLGGDVLTALNQEFVNRFADRIKIYNFNARQNVVLHSKLLMIDEKLVVISSVNFNHRSFIHDSENGVMIIDPAFYNRMQSVFEDYRQHSSPAPRARIPYFWKILTSISLLKNAL
ncbi:phospholipase D-like domain-containing protein [Rhizobium alvei]|uniref:Phospholipase D n=1 Tax=Rhizobium alvei TaxID=1132659 RepID=A0ABT8YPZ4_9HYPH|nr:phosphatidylserine/phosphatidylglycerophosphate/cardiolipin synthase family protein [Rhizobium alvei]MDO6965779.1 phosphatidylserine/phosphatidylglycerophosphate/cardiolipin synthase family protein [Rhizobium alvei]